MQSPVNSHSDWAEEALNLPLRFAQVREDPLLDSWVVEQLPSDTTLLVVGSGGCTLAVLSTLPSVESVHVVDPNPAQLALCRLKMALLQSQYPASRLEILGHRILDPEKRQGRIDEICDRTGDSSDVFGSADSVFELGLDYAGRYESVFRQISNSVEKLPDNVLELLRLTDASAQVRWLQAHPHFVAGLLQIFDRVMKLENLVALFGAAATQNRVMEFSKHFFHRTLHALHSFNASTNHFLWQVLASSTTPKPAAEWLSLPKQTESPELRYEPATVQDYLAQTDLQFDYIHLSNVLDWLTIDEARSMLELTWNRLKPRGYTLIRQLNSDLPIRALEERFTWLDEESDRLYRHDQSFFYQSVHCGRKL